MSAESRLPNKAIPHEALLEHRDFVRRLATQLVRDDALAEDVAQDAWLAAVANPPRRDGVRAWLRQVARRLAMRHRRTETRRLRREALVARDEAYGTDVAHELAHHEILRQVTDAVVRLAPLYREVVMLHFYRGLSADAIALRMDLPRATVYTRLRRALALLRFDLEQRLGVEEWRGAVALLAAAPVAAVTRAGPESVPTATCVRPRSGIPAAPVGWIAAVLTIGVGMWMIVDTRPSDEIATASRASERAFRMKDDALAKLDMSSDAGSETRIVASTPIPASPRASVVATSTTPASDRASLTVRIVWDATSEPVADRGVRALIAPDPTCGVPGTAATRRLVDLRSDTDGLIVLRDLAPGTVRLVDDVGPYDLVAGTLSVRVEAGENLVREIRLPDGRTLEGHVVDGDDRPIAGASIWTSDYYNRTNGHIVATTDSDGSFVIRGVSDGRWIAAYAAGLVPSRLISLEGLPGETLWPRVVLEHGGAALVGSVVDHEGIAVENARIHVASAHEPCATDRFGTVLSNRLVRTGRTDADGRFEIPSIAPGKATVSVVASGYATKVHEVDFASGRTKTIELEVEPSLTVQGVVRDAAGRPVASARVVTRSREPFGFRAAESNASGAYALGGLAPGTTLRFRHEQLGIAEARVDGAPGETIRVDVELDRGITLEGHIVDADRQPLADRLVRARGSRHLPDTNHLWSAEARTDEAGRFAIVGVPEETIHITVASEHDRERAIANAEIEISPAVAPVATLDPIVIDRTEAGTALVHGRAVDAGGLPVAARFTLRTDFAPFIESTRSTLDGSFTFPRIPPGSYRLTAETEQAPAISLGEVNVQPGDTCDLGPIVLDQPATVTIDVAGHDELGPYDSVQVSTGGRSFRFAPGLHRNLVVWPGLVRVVLVGHEAAVETFEIELRPGETAHHTVTPRRGIPCRFEVAIDGDRTPHMLGFALHDAKGLISYDAFPTAQDDTPAIEYRLARGDYRLVVAEPAGTSVEKTFTIHSGIDGFTKRIEYRSR